MREKRTQGKTRLRTVPLSQCGGRVGTTKRMGPGYFPIAPAVILILFGLWVLVRGIYFPGPVKGGWSWLGGDL